MKQLTIESQSKKGRAFSATLLAYVEADDLWSGGRTSNDTTRPVWMMVAGPETGLRPFTANILLGRKAEYKEGYGRKKKFELLKSSGHHQFMQRTSAGIVSTFYLPELFRIDPGMVDPEGIKFVVLPTRDWIDSQHFESDRILTHMVDVFKRMYPDREFDEVAQNATKNAALATLFCTYLDRRTRCPLIPDVRFFTQVFTMACAEHLALSSVFRDQQQYSYGRNAFGFEEHGIESIGLSPGVACSTTHEVLEMFLAKQVDIYFKVTRG